MKLKNKQFEDVVVGAEKELEFSIDTDSHLIFEILRDKMYKDKIGSICREVLSNCRDANREAGNDKNISATIIEPNQIVYIGHQSIAFKDNGLGITPDRMADIYVKYAASTKRDSNGQTGGFGLGAKTPFAYNDTFTVVTVCDYEGKRMKYYYTALIDSSRKGKMILFDTEETTEDTGTQVIVPIKTPSDRIEFEKKAFFYTKFWGDVDYINFSINTDIPKIIKDTPTYSVVEGENTYLIIDGIPYPLESGWGFENLKLARGNAIAMKFNTGELTISANRESIQYDEDTVETIKQRTIKIKGEFEQELTKFLDTFPTYLDACRFKASFSNRMFPKLEEGSMDYVLASAIGIDSYSNYMLTKMFNNSVITYKGRDVVTKIKFKHHTLERVKDKDYIYDSRGRVYKLYESLPLSQLDQNNIYYNTGGKSSRRNATIYQDLCNSEFYLISPKGSSSQQEIDDEIIKMKNDFEIRYKMYQDVTPMPVERKKRVSSKIGATKYQGWQNYYMDVYYDKEAKLLYADEECDDLLNLDKRCFMPVDRVTTRLSLYTDRDKADFLRNHGYTVILVCFSNWDKKISKCKGVEYYLDTYNRIYKENQDRWIKEGSAYLLREAVTDVSHGILEYVEVLPDSILPKTVKALPIDELKEAGKFSSSYTKVKGQIKINREGLSRKLERNLSRYPLLRTYIDYADNKEEVIKQNIKDYIKQVDNYEIKN